MTLTEADGHLYYADACRRTEYPNDAQYFLPLDEAITSRAVIAIVPGSADGRANGRTDGRKRLWSQISTSRTVIGEPKVSMGSLQEFIGGV